jgi:conjugative transfer region protein TrbK
VDTKLLARIGAITFVAIAITMTAIELRDAPRQGVDETTTPIVSTDVDPLRDELIRCQSIGLAGASDAACLRAWAENRRRFLAPGARPKERLPEAATAFVETSNMDVMAAQNASAPDTGR